MRQQGFPLSFSIIDRTTTQAVGASYIRITPEHRVIEIGNIFYTPALAGTRVATEAMYLLAQYAFADLGFRRYEWKCNAWREPDLSVHALSSEAPR
jgi:RimJ/RimL family protein N-acetyltransferase